MEIEIDLSSDWIKYMRSKIITSGYSADMTEHPDDLSYKFFNIYRRRVPELSRTVHEPSKFSCPQEHQSGYIALKNKFANGDDVAPYLSKKILSNNYEDPLLNDWGIHHFHLGEYISNGFADRTGPLLFALVRDADIYCIDIKAHGAWSEQNLIRTLHEEWPETIEKYRIKGISGLTYQPTNNDVAQFRKAGVQTMVQLDEGVVYAPIGGGYSTAGTSIQAQMSADHYRHLVCNIEKYVKENADMFIEKLREHGLRPKSKPHFQLLVDEEGFHTIELGSGVMFLMHPHGQS